MSRPIIEVSNLSKRYLLGDFGARTLREEAELLVSRFWKRNAHAPSATKNNEQGAKNKELKTKNERDFWALRDVSFTVQPGEVLGIIGRNGAGKSTLLKILSRITEPSDGEAIIRGRVASLLEVGTGFHPELSGRENIYLNGAILGMRKAEIDRKFDEIVAFAEIDQFLDTPVKRYSSGMYVRLAFAVAAHLDPEILIVDEVLAVGDAQFQKKCVGKMQEASHSEGRTVIFVSHNIAAISGLCTSGLVLEHGRVVHRGPIATAVDRYISASADSNLQALSMNRPAVIGMDYISAGSGQNSGLWDCSCPLPITIRYSVQRRVKNLEITIRLERAGSYVGTCFVSEYSGITLPATPGSFELSIDIAPMALLNDLYQVHVWFGDPHHDFYAEYHSALTLTVVNRRHDPARTADAFALGPMLVSPNALPSVRALPEAPTHQPTGSI